MKVKRTISSKILLVEIVGLSIAIGVIFFDFYLSFTKSQITEEQSIVIKPLDGEIDKKVIDNLSGRNMIREVDLNSLNNISVTQIASKSANIKEEAPPLEVSLPGNITGAGGSTESASTIQATESSSLQMNQ